MRRSQKRKISVILHFWDQRTKKTAQKNVDEIDTWSSVLKSCQIANSFTGEPKMFTVFVMFGIVHDLRVDRLQAEGHDQGVDDSVLGQEVARLVPVPRVRHNLGSISPTFSVQFLCMQISKAQKILIAWLNFYTFVICNQQNFA